jgi:hypothetical protein
MDFNTFIIGKIFYKILSIIIIFKKALEEIT